METEAESFRWPSLYHKARSTPQMLQRITGLPDGAPQPSADRAGSGAQTNPCGAPHLSLWGQLWSSDKWGGKTGSGGRSPKAQPCLGREKLRNVEHWPAGELSDDLWVEVTQMLRTWRCQTRDGLNSYVIKTEIQREGKSVMNSESSLPLSDLVSMTITENGPKTARSPKLWLMTLSAEEMDRTEAGSWAMVGRFVPAIIPERLHMSPNRQIFTQRQKFLSDVSLGRRTGHR